MITYIDNALTKGDKMAKFEKGGKYATRSVCDHNCIFRIEVLDRTAKTIKAKIDGRSDIKTLRISEYEGVEQVKPLGSYSMAPVIDANDKARGQ